MNSLFLCSSDCLALDPRANSTETSFTASSSFLMALAISLEEEEEEGNEVNQY